MKKQKRISKFFSTLLAFALLLSSIAAVPLATSAESESRYPFRLAEIKKSDFTLAWSGYVDNGWLVYDDLDTGGLRLDMNTNVFRGGVRVTGTCKYQLDGFYIQFDNYSSTDTTNARLDFAFKQTVNQELCFDLNTVDGTITYYTYDSTQSDTERTNPVATGSLLTSDSLKYDNLTGKPFGYQFNLVDGALKISVYVEKTLVAEGTVPAEVFAATTINPASTGFDIGGHSDNTIFKVDVVGYGYGQPTSGQTYADGLTEITVDDIWRNDTNSFAQSPNWGQLTVSGGSNASGKGVNLLFRSDAYLGGVRTGVKTKTFDLDGLYVQLDNYTCSDTSKAMFGFLMATDLNNNYGGNYFGILLDAVNGRLVSVQSSGNPVAISETYDGLKYNKICNRPIAFCFTDLGDDGIQVTVFVNGESYNGTVPNSVITGTTNFNRSAAVLFFGSDSGSARHQFDVIGYKSGVNVDYQSVISAIDSIGTVTLDTQKVHNARNLYDALDDSVKPSVTNYSTLVAAEEEFYALAKDADKTLTKLKANDVNQTMRGTWTSMMTNTGLATGGVRFKFTNAVTDVRNGIDKFLELDGLTLQFDNINAKSASSCNFTILISDTNKNYPYTSSFYSKNEKSLALVLDAANGKIVAKVNGKTDDAMLCNEDVIVNDALKLENIKNRRFSYRFDVVDDGDVFINLTVTVDGQEYVGEIPYAVMDAMETLDGYTDLDDNGNPEFGGGLKTELLNQCFVNISNVGTSTYSVDLIGYGYNYSGYTEGGINNSDLMPAYVPDSEVTLDSNNTPDWADELIITQVNPYNAGGSFAALYPLLEHLEETGVNGLWLTPVYARGASGNGYGNIGVNTIDPSLTGTDDYTEGWQVLRAFVDEAHKHNIRVFLDVSSWGTTADSPLYTEHQNWYKAQYTPDNLNQWGGLEFDWTNTDLQTWYVNQLVNNAVAANIDGYRFDLEPGTAGYDIDRQVKNKLINEYSKKIFTIAEGSNTRSGAYDTEQCAIDTYNESGTRIYDRDRLNFLETSPIINDDRYNIVDMVKNGDYIFGSSAYKYYIQMLSCHDNFNYGVNSSELAIGYQAIFSPFIPLWYLGDEMGLSNTNGTENVLYFSNVSGWRKALDNTENREFFEQVKAMIRIRRTYTSVFGDSAEQFKNSNICKVETENGNLQAYARYADDTAFLVIPNKTADAADVTVKMSLADMGISGYETYTVTDAMTETVLYENVTASALASLTVNVTGNSQRVLKVEATAVKYDVNGDKAFNSLDLAALRSYLLGADVEIVKGDFNGDNAIDIIDLIIIKKELAKIS